MPTGLSVKFPLSISDQGDFTLNNTVKDMVKQNFKNLLLTVPGERIMIPDFGVGVSRYLFEQKGVGLLESMSSAINAQVSKYMPYIQITDINLSDNEQSEEIVSIKIKYFIKPLSETDILEIITT
jgi:phage baseplate assembly protein W